MVCPWVSNFFSLVESMVGFKAGCWLFFLLLEWVGFLLILPGSRDIISAFVKKRFIKYVKENKVNVYTNKESYKNKDYYRENDYREDDYIDVEAEEVKAEEDEDQDK